MDKWSKLADRQTIASLKASNIEAKFVENGEEAKKEAFALLPEGVVGSAVNKLLIINKEVKQGRITLILVNEVLGF